MTDRAAELASRPVPGADCYDLNERTWLNSVVDQLHWLAHTVRLYTIRKASPITGGSVYIHDFAVATPA